MEKIELYLKNQIRIYEAFRNVATQLRQEKNVKFYQGMVDKLKRMIIILKE